MASVTYSGVTTNYATIEDAWEAATTQSGSTLKLLTNAQTSGTQSLNLPSGITVTLDLNGYVLSHPTNATIAVLDVYGTLNIVDTSVNKQGAITGNAASSYSAGGISISGTVNLQSGSIANCTNSSGTGGVYIPSGTLNMTGGSIKNNEGQGNGGGVYNRSGYFNMSGGSIENNIVYNTQGNSTQGGGVDNSGSKGTKISGSAVINNNTKEIRSGASVVSSSASNLYIQNNYNTVTIIAALDSAADIYVSFNTNGTSPFDFSQKASTVYTLSSSDLAKITSDDGMVGVLNTENNYIYFGVPPTITTQPDSADRSVTVDNTATSYSVSASGVNNTYQWQVSTLGNDNVTWSTFSNVAVNTGNSGGTDAAYTTPSSLSAGKYKYRCIVKNDYETTGITSNETGVLSVLEYTDAPSADNTYTDENKYTYLQDPTTNVWEATYVKSSSADVLFKLTNTSYDANTVFAVYDIIDATSLSSVTASYDATTKILTLSAPAQGDYYISAKNSDKATSKTRTRFSVLNQGIAAQDVVMYKGFVSSASSSAGFREINTNQDQFNSASWSLSWDSGSTPTGILATPTRGTLQASGSTKSADIVFASDGTTPSGTYYYTVSASGVSTSGKVIVKDPSFSLTSPSDVLVKESSTDTRTATFSVDVSDKNPDNSVTYQWQKSTDGGTTYSNITNATSASYTESNVKYAQNGYKYRCIVSLNVTGRENPTSADIYSKTSSEATLSVKKTLESVSFSGGSSPKILVGDTLNFTGSYSSGGDSATYTYYYLNNYSPITGESGNETTVDKSYTTQAGDVGSQIKVSVTPNGEYQGSVTQSAGYVYAQISSVAITGTPQQSQTLTANITSTGNSPTATYQWYADSVAITNATNSTYTLTSNEVGKNITVKVTGTSSGYYLGSATSAPTEKVSGSLSGVSISPSTDIKINTELSAKTAPVDIDDNTQITYQWYRSNTNDISLATAITGATNKKYTTTASDTTKYLFVKALPVSGGNYTGEQTSSSVYVKNNDATLSALSLSDGTSAVVLNPVFSSSLTEYTAATKELSVTLAATPTDTNATVTYKFNSSATTNTTYTLTDGKNEIEITVKAEDNTTTKTYKINVYKLSKPTVSSSTPKVGTSINATPAPSTASVNYQWQYYVSGAWVDIPSATSASYTPDSTVIGAKVRLSSTGTGNYAGVTTYSDETGIVTANITSVTLDNTSPKNGDTLSATIEPDNANATYIWQRSTSVNGPFTDIAGATSSTYTVTSDDIGCYLKLTATGVAPYTSSASVTTGIVTLNISITPVNTFIVKTAPTDMSIKIGEGITGLTINNFDSLYIDNVLVTETNFTLTNGSIVINLSKSYLDTLSLGEHSVKVNLKGGVFANTYAITTISVNPSTNPTTSDNSRITLLVLLFTIAFVMTVIIFIKNKNTRHEH